MSFTMVHDPVSNLNQYKSYKSQYMLLKNRSIYADEKPSLKFE